VFALLESLKHFMFSGFLGRGSVLGIVDDDVGKVRKRRRRVSPQDLEDSGRGGGVGGGRRGGGE
jgi:hypothetical protein